MEVIVLQRAGLARVYGIVQLRVLYVVCTAMAGKNLVNHSMH